MKFKELEWILRFSNFTVSSCNWKFRAWDSPQRRKKTTGNPVRSDLAPVLDRVRRSTWHSSSLTRVYTWFSPGGHVSTLCDDRWEAILSKAHTMDGWFRTVMQTNRSNFIARYALLPAVISLPFAIIPFLQSPQFTDHLYIITWQVEIQYVHQTTSQR